MKTIIALISILMLSACASEPPRHPDVTQQPFRSCNEIAQEVREKIIRVGAPKILKRVQPRYPKPMIKDACVYIVYDVTPEGVADNFRIVEANPPDPKFSVAALKALTKWEFEKKEFKNASLTVQFMVN